MSATNDTNFTNLGAAQIGAFGGDNTKLWVLACLLRHSGRRGDAVTFYTNPKAFGFTNCTRLRVAPGFRLSTLFDALLSPGSS
jgi:hypothetical protein